MTASESVEFALAVGRLEAWMRGAIDQRFSVQLCDGERVTVFTYIQEESMGYWHSPVSLVSEVMGGVSSDGEGIK